MKTNMTLMQKLFHFMTCLFVTRNVFADEPAPTETQTTTPATTPTQPKADPKPSFNFEDAIQEARKQEREKLYPQIEKLKADRDRMVEANNQNLITIGEKDTRIRDLERDIKELNKKLEGKPDSAEITTLKNRVAELEGQIADAEKARKEEELKSYRVTKIASANGNIIDDLVSGNTTEEIDASFEKAVAKYNELASKFGSQITKPNSNYAPAPNINTQTIDAKEINMAELQMLDMSKPENRKKYAEARKKLGLA
jgi:hypothetical protein